VSARIVECGVVVVVPPDAAGERVSSVADIAVKTVRSRCAVVEQRLADLSDLATVEAYDGGLCLLKREC